MNKEMFPEIRVTKKLDLTRLALLLDMLTKGNPSLSQSEVVRRIQKLVNESGMTWDMILGIGVFSQSKPSEATVRESLRAVKSSPLEWWTAVQKTKTGIPWDSWIRTLYVARYKEFVTSVSRVYKSSGKLTNGQIVTLHGILERAGLAR